MIAISDSNSLLLLWRTVVNSVIIYVQKTSTIIHLLLCFLAVLSSRLTEFVTKSLSVSCAKMGRINKYGKATNDPGQLFENLSCIQGRGKQGTIASRLRTPSRVVCLQNR